MREAEDMSIQELHTMLEKVKPGDAVTAFGKATTGAEVTRQGVLLADPQEMKATHNGVKVAAIRVRVGEAGTDPAKRSTWTTLIPGHGFILPAGAPEPEQGTEVEQELEQDQGPEAPEVEHQDQAAELAWEAVQAREVERRGPFLYGGKGTKGTSPQRPVRVKVGRQWFGHMELVSVDTGEVVLSPKNVAKIWAAPIPEGWEPEQHQEVTELEHGQPVYHVVTGALVGYWTLAKFTPVEELKG
ncbi:hypothetical protein ACG2OD_14645 [Streptomyces sp. PDY-4]|uniref:hypothetical protein n=1 Tax=Streptomyces sp. PDY-4 TaxID=3376070 RepID=UPI003788AF12